MNSKGFEHAKAVYAALAKDDAASKTVPLVELVDGKMKLESSAKLTAHIAADQNYSEVHSMKYLNERSRQLYNLPNTASDAELDKARTASEAWSSQPNPADTADSFVLWMHCILCAEICLLQHS